MTDWSLAACLGDSLSLWFPPKGTSGEAVDEVRAICQRCPILRDCDAYAVDVAGPGIFAGMSERQRARRRSGEATFESVWEQFRRRRQRQADRTSRRAAAAAEAPQRRPVVTADDWTRARQIIVETAADFGLDVDELIGRSRNRTLLGARAAAMEQIYKTTRLSLSQVGRLFDGRDHTTVLHNINVHLKEAA